MLNMECTLEIVDVIHGSIMCSGIEREIIGNPFFNRLHKVHQSSLVFLTYPSNKVMRFEHSIGTMHLAGQFFFKSVCNTPSEELEKFFQEINAEIVNWNSNVESGDLQYIDDSTLSDYADSNILEAPIPENQLYFQNTPANLISKYRFAYYVVFQSIRLSGMLHDVGHLPYSHILEHALNLLYHKVLNVDAEKRNEAHNHFIDTISKYCTSDDFAIHEELGKHFVDKIFSNIVKELPTKEDNTRYFLAAVIYFTKKILCSQNGENTIFSDLHRIVAGTIDCDRMDYCCRDMFFSGISKELPNYSRIFNTIRMKYRDTEKSSLADDDDAPPLRQRCFFTPSTKAVGQIENLLQRRWDIYSTINFHHRVHKHELLLENAIAELGLQEMESGEKPETIKNVLPLKVSSIWQLISQMNRSSPIEYVALQLDDSWLDTLLKHKYFDQYAESFLSRKKHANDPNWNRLDELISSKKHYYSLLKRSDDFRQFDELLYDVLKKNPCSVVSNVIDLDKTGSYTGFLNQEGEFLFNRIVRIIAPSKDLREKLFMSLKTALHIHIKEEESLNIVDCFLSDCTFSSGIRQSDPLYIISSKNEVKPFFHYTSLCDDLVKKRNLLPSFHLYYLPAYDLSSSRYLSADTDRFLQLLAQSIADQFSNWRLDS